MNKENKIMKKWVEVILLEVVWSFLPFFLKRKRKMKLENPMGPVHPKWGPWRKNFKKQKVGSLSLSIRARFRSWDLWVMGPPRFRCATLIC